MDLFDGREDKKIRKYSNLSRSERSKQRNMQGTLSTTIEEIATRLSNAKVFSIFDVKNGFCM